MYKSQAAEQGQPGAGPGPDMGGAQDAGASSTPENDAEDADYEVVDDDK